MPLFTLPSDRSRACIFGRTGSGKTVFATWLLSHASIDTQPWIIIDYKRDSYLKSLPYVQKIKLGELPREPGLYIIAADFGQEDDVDVYLHRMIARGDIGLFTDEGANLPHQQPRYTGLRTIFAQGRSKRVPVIFATQRPAWINRSVLSESDFFSLFDLSVSEDRQRANSFMPDEVRQRGLDEYHSYWYDVKRKALMIVRPVDEPDTIARLAERLRPRIVMI
jgi:DNA helicase HerA-like ATPase